MTEVKAENPLHVSWHDSAWIPHLNPTNVLDYFCERSNPFYDRTCNNEIVKMQRLDPEQMVHMTGLEYILLHVQEPILYVIRKQIRRSDSQNVCVSLADYYVLAGVVYQAPDLKSIIDCRVSAAIENLTQAFKDFQAIQTFSPATGSSWTVVKEKGASQCHKTEIFKKKDPSPEDAKYTHFQINKVGNLIRMLQQDVHAKQLADDRKQQAERDQQSGQSDPDQPGSSREHQGSQTQQIPSSQHTQQQQSLRYTQEPTNQQVSAGQEGQIMLQQEQFIEQEKQHLAPPEQQPDVEKRNMNEEPK